MARTTPSIEPDPPKMLTPPSRTIVMMSSSKNSPRLPRTDPTRGREEDTGESRYQPGCDEQSQLDPGDVETREAGDIGAVTDHVDGPPEWSRFEE